MINKLKIDVQNNPLSNQNDGLASKRPESKHQFERREYQEVAINNSVKHFEENDRGTLVMACGTGKTITSVKIWERQDANLTLVLVPSLDLLRQFKKSWQENTEVDFDALSVCSDVDLNRDNLEEDQIAVPMSEIGGEVVGSSSQIFNFISKKSGQKKVIFSTYQSLPKIEEALKNKNIKLDFIISDEAHKTASVKDSHFTLVHDNQKIPSKKRLYMTATPKIFNLAKQKGQEAEIAFDMSNEDVYGKQFFKISLKEAIEKDILTDYRLVLVGVDKKLKLEQKLESFKNTPNIEKIHAKLLAKTIEKNGLTHVISYHGSVKKAQEMATEINKNNLGIYAQNVNGKQGTKEREGIINQFKIQPKALLTNARCLQEGVDIPSVDAAYIADPVSSIIANTQILGRTVRKCEGKKVATMIIPILDVPVEDSLQQSAQNSRFEQVLNIIRALANEDEGLQEMINQASKANTSNLKKGLKEDKENQKIYEQFKQKIKFEDIDFDLTDLIVQEILERNRTENEPSWYYKLEALKDFIEWTERVEGEKRIPLQLEKHTFNKKEINIGAWLNSQKNKIKSGELTGEKLERFNQVVAGLELHQDLDKLWENSFSSFKSFIQYIEKVEGKKRLPKFKEKYIFNNEEINTGNWLSNQKQNIKHGKLNGDKLQRFNEVVKEFELYKDLDKLWENNFNALKSFIKDKNRLPTQREASIGAWLNTQKNKIKYGELTGEKLERLNKVIKAVDLTRDKLWENSFSTLKSFIQYIEKVEGKKRLPKFTENHIFNNEEINIGGWLTNQKQHIKKNLSTPERIKKLASIPQFKAWMDESLKN